MVSVGGTSDDSVFECTVDGCDRRLVFHHRDGRSTVLAHGTPGALHQGSTGLVSLAGDLAG